MLLLNNLIGFGVGGALQWVDSYGPIAFDSNTGSWAGYNVRQIFLGQVNGNNVRVTFVAPTDSGLVVPVAYIGRGATTGDIYDFASTPTELKFGGASGFSLSAGQSITSDPLPFTFLAGFNHIISYYITSGNARYQAAAGAYHSYWLSTAQAATSQVDVSGYSVSTGRLQSVSRVEVADGTTTYAVWSQWDKYSSNITLSSGNLNFAWAGSGVAGCGRATKGMSSGKWYWEITCVAGSSSFIIGWGTAAFNLGAGYVGSQVGGWGYYGTSGAVISNTTTVISGLSTYGAGDILSFAFDADVGRMFIAKNGVWQNSGDPVLGTGACVTGLTSGPYYPACGDTSSGSDSGNVTANFGASTFAYTPPTGYSGLRVYPP